MANNFALNVNSPDSQVIASLNYALANMGTGVAAVEYEGNILVANSATGVVQTVTSGGIRGPVYGYLYDYLAVKYANSATGGSGFTSNATLANYYGIRNSNSSVISNNPVDYQWTQVAGGFGTTKGLWYFNRGGGQIDITVSTLAPTLNFSPVVDNTPIFLPAVAANIVYGNVIVPGSITNVQIASNTIIAQNIQDYAIGQLQIANLAISSSKIQLEAVTTSLIAANAITSNLVAYGAITNTQIATSTITGTLIAQDTITGNLIAQSTLTGNLFALNTITGNLVAQNTITGNLIAQNTITGNLIVPGTIYGNAILANSFQANTINGNSIVAGSITAEQLAANAITANTVVSSNAIFGDPNSPGFWLDGNTGNARFGNSVSIGGVITNGNIGTAVIFDNMIGYYTIDGNARIMGETIGPGLLAPYGISASRIANAAITAQQIANQTLTNAQIALSTITGDLIQGQTITGSLIALNTITGNLVALNTITGNLIAQNTITGNLVATNTIYGNSIVSGSITTDQLAANVLTVNTVVSTGATLGSNSSVGFWLNGNTGSARFGNTVSIGNLLTVGSNAVIGNNAVIGGNLFVAGLISTGNLNANTVYTPTINLNAVSTIAANSTSSVFTVSNPQANVYYSTGCNVSLTTATTNNSFLISLADAVVLDIGTASNQYAWRLITRVRMTDPSSNVYDLLDVANDEVGFVNYFTSVSATNISSQYFIAPQGSSPAGTYTFYLQMAYYPVTANVYYPRTSLNSGGRQLTVSLFKR